MKKIKKLAAAAATAFTLGATGALAQTAGPAAGASPDACQSILVKSDLISCLGAFENDVTSYVTRHQVAVLKTTEEMKNTGTSLSCLTADELERGLAQALPSLTTDLSKPAEVEHISQVQALFAATAGCLDTITSLIEANDSVTNPQAMDRVVPDLRMSANTARRMADSLRLSGP